MKKILLIAILLACMLKVSSDPVIDSLKAIINHDTSSVETRLTSYEGIINHCQNIDIDRCYDAYLKAVEFAQKVGSTRYESHYTTLIGTVYYYQGDYKKTAEYWLKALSISEKAKDTMRIEQMYNNLGIFYQTTGEYELSRKYYAQSLKLRLKSGNPSKIAIAQMNYGTLLHKLQEYDSAYLYLNDALKVFKKDGKDLRALSTIYNNLGSVHLAKQEYQMAIENYYKANDIINYLPVYERAVLLLNMANCLIVYLEKPEEGMIYIEKSLEMAKENDNLRVIKNVYEIYSRYYAKIGDFKNAFQYQELSSLYNDSLYSIEKEKQIKELQATFDFEQKESQLNQKMEIEQIKNIRQRRINRIMTAIIVFVVLAMAIIIYLLVKINRAKVKIELTQNELKETYNNLLIAKEETERALEFKSRFLANMSHEVRTPLNIIIGFNSNLKTKIKDLKLLEYVYAIEIGSYNLLALLNDILDMSKIEAGHIKLNPVNTNLNSLVYDAWYSFSIKAQDKKIDFSYKYDDNLPDHFIIDPILLRQIINNLLSNALKFTHEGFIKIEVVKTNPDSSIFSTSLYNLEIRVEDTGIGIPKEEQEHIFEAFYQAKVKPDSFYGGTGLGLAISKELAHLMGGDLILQSEPCKGSKFTIQLYRLSTGQAETIEFKSPEIKASQVDFTFTGGVLLVADDEELNRKMIKSFFEETAVEVLLAKNGKELIEKAKEKQPTVILSDMKMPVMDGIEAAKILKADPVIKDIPVIAFTASIDFPRLKPEIRNLFSGCINKPVDIIELYERLAFYLPNTKTEERYNKPTSNI